MPTIRDVAREAGVSTATVSAVLTKKRFVSEELIKRVNEAIKVTGYRRNTLASGLKSGRTGLIGLVVPDVTNPFFTDFVDLIETRAKAAGYSIIFGISKNSVQRERELLELLSSHQAEGTIVCPVGSPEDTEALAASHNCPMVAVDNADPDGTIDSITIDNRAAGGLAANHFLPQGHRIFAVVSGPEQRISSAHRVEGFMAVVDKVPDTKVSVVNGHFTPEGGYEACKEILRMTPRPTAIFVTNNQMLIGVIQALTEENLDVPNEISTLSLDDFPWADSFRPSLTTIRQPLEEIAAECWAVLESRLKDPKGEVQSRVLQPQLIVRTSTAPPTV